MATRVPPRWNRSFLLRSLTFNQTGIPALTPSIDRFQAEEKNREKICTACKRHKQTVQGRPKALLQTWCALRCDMEFLSSLFADSVPNGNARTSLSPHEFLEEDFLCCFASHIDGFVD